MFVDQLIGADAVALAELDVATRTDDVAVFVLQLAVVDAARELAHVAQVRHVRPVLLENGARIRVDFGLPDDAHACAFKAQVEAADAGEETADSKHVAI